MEEEMNLYENPRYQREVGYFMSEDSFLIARYSASVSEFAPANKFYYIHKIFYENGNPREITKVQLGGLIFYKDLYDIEGNIISSGYIDHDINKITIDGLDYISFLENEGWFDRSKGTNAFSKLPNTTGKFTNTIFFHISIFKSEDKSKYIVDISGQKVIPQCFLEKYSKENESGNRYLQLKNGDIIDVKQGKVNRIEVKYIIDIENGSYEVCCEYADIII